MTSEQMIESLSDEVCWQIAAKLDGKNTPNWKTLVQCLPKVYQNEKKILKYHLEVLKPNGSPTLTLLSELSKKPVQDLVNWLTSLKTCPDLVDLLLNGGRTVRDLHPVITTQPNPNDSYTVGEDIAIGFGVTGKEPYQFQWFKGVTTLQNQTKNVLFLSNGIVDSGLYTCRVSNQYGYAFTVWIKITVCDDICIEFDSPLVTMHPRSVQCVQGDTIRLYADAVGNPPPFLQWYKDDEQLLGECSRELTIKNVTLQQHDGLYKFKASNKHGTTTSIASQVTVTKCTHFELPTSIPMCSTVAGTDFLSGNKSHLDISAAYEPRGQLHPQTTIIESIYAPDQPTEKVALLIGNEDYIMKDELGKLVHPVNDTFDVSAALGSIGFKAVSLINLDLAAMREAVKYFSKLIDIGTYAVFYFAGHGFEINGESFLMPINASNRYDPNENFGISEILKVMTDERKQAKLSVLLLDCCRTDPRTCRIDPMPQFMSSLVQRKNVIIGYGCCSQGRVLESPVMKNGYFAKSLVENITRNIKIDDVMFEVSRDIHAQHIIDPATKRSQVVYRHSTVVDDLRLTQAIRINEPIRQVSQLWEQAHIEPTSPVKIIETDYASVELIFTAQFSNCLIIQCKVKTAPIVSDYNVSYVLSERIGGARVEIIFPDEKSKNVFNLEKIQNKVVRISNLEYLKGNIEIHGSVVFNIHDEVTEQFFIYTIEEKPLYAKIVENTESLLS